MLLRIVAYSLIATGIAGLLIPLVPAIFMITAGALILYKQTPHIDWRWVKKELSRTERIDLSDSADKKAHIKECAKRSLEEARRLVKPRSVFITKKVGELENVLNLKDSAISSYIDGAGSINVFLVSIGERLENEASKLMNEGHSLEGYILDRIGSLAVESLAENFEKKVRGYYKIQRGSVSTRFSPGYCNWPIEEQRALSKIIDFSKAGVALNEKCMMVPKKSISAIIAIGPKGKFSKTKSLCNVCELKECGYRR